MSDVVERFCAARGLPADLPEETRRTLAAEIQKGKREYLTAALAFERRMTAYDLEPELRPTSAKRPIAETASPETETLEAAVGKYLEENQRFRGWEPKTVAEKTDALNLLMDMVGRDNVARSLTKADARHVKGVLLRLPKNRRKNPLTRDLSLHEALEVPGVPKIGAVRVNGYPREALKNLGIGR